MGGNLFVVCLTSKAATKTLLDEKSCEDGISSQNLFKIYKTCGEYLKEPIPRNLYRNNWRIVFGFREEFE